MFRLFLRTVGICLLIALTSCGRFDVKMDLPHYSMGPVKSSNFPTLVQEAMTAGDQEALLFGRVWWFGFSGSPGFSATSPYFSGVAALTETEIVLLLWNEIEETYEIVSRVPYANLNLVSKGRELYFKDKEFSFGQETFTDPESLTKHRPKKLFLCSTQKLNPILIPIGVSPHRSMANINHEIDPQVRFGSEAAQRANAGASSEMRRIAELIQCRSLDTATTASGQKRLSEYLYDLQCKIGAAGPRMAICTNTRPGLDHLWAAAWWQCAGG
jgi:hypothetical protein